MGGFTIISLRSIFKKSVLPLICIITMTLCSCAVISSGAANDTNDSGELEISILKIGKADAAILTTENHSILIDCGEEDDGEEILKNLSNKGITNVDYLFITHFDKDHVGGVCDIIKGVEIGQIITPNYVGTGSAYKNYVNAAKENGVAPLKLTEEMSFTLDNVAFEVYPPKKTSYETEDNDFSLAITATCGNNGFLFAGDAEVERMQEILSQTNREFDFLKFPHHGCYNDYIQTFVEGVNPSYVVITCSDKNKADPRTIEIIENAGGKVYYTKDGDVTIKSDGREITIEQ